MNWTDEDRAEVTDLGATEYGALVRDARRYRWLRDADHDWDVFFPTDKNASGVAAWHGCRDRDAAIDAAMEAAK